MMGLSRKDRSGRKGGDAGLPILRPAREEPPAGAADDGGGLRRRLLLELFLKTVCGMAPNLAVGLAVEMAPDLPVDGDRLICARLGHPRTSLGGSEIPREACCREENSVPPLCRLTEIPPGAEAEVCLLVTRFASRLDRLAPFGIVPGNRVRVRRLRPAVVLEIGETTLALDRAVAEDIFVIPLTPAR